MQFLGCLFFLLFGVFIIFFAVFGNLIRMLWGVKKATKKFKNAAKEQQKQESQFSQERHEHRKKEKGKIFDKSEGEYIEFEEIK